MYIINIYYISIITLAFFLVTTTIYTDFLPPLSLLSGMYMVKPLGPLGEAEYQQHSSLRSSLSFYLKAEQIYIGARVNQSYQKCSLHTAMNV